MAQSVGRRQQPVSQSVFASPGFEKKRQEQESLPNSPVKLILQQDERSAFDQEFEYVRLAQLKHKIEDLKEEVKRKISWSEQRQSLRQMTALVGWHVETHEDIRLGISSTKVTASFETGPLSSPLVVQLCVSEMASFRLVNTAFAKVWQFQNNAFTFDAAAALGLLNSSGVGSWKIDPENDSPDRITELRWFTADLSRIVLESISERLCTVLHYPPGTPALAISLGANNSIVSLLGLE